MIDPDADYETLVDLEILNGIQNTCYLQGLTHVPKQENINLAWEYAQSPADHDHFINMLRVSPEVFDSNHSSRELITISTVLLNYYFLHGVSPLSKCFPYCRY